jgi:PAT family beta-lactamase induction signal transducer AmpG
MLFLGFSAGIPSMIIFSTLSLWLREAGIERSAVTFFSWASLGYSFKFVWAPMIDQLPVPVLTKKLGRRRAWMLVSQLAIVLCIVFMALVDPSKGQNAIAMMFAFALALGFSSATQDIVIDAYRIEAAVTELQGMMASAYVAGYRIAMIVAGAGSLYLADRLGSKTVLYKYAAWEWTYLIMALTMVAGIATTLVIDEPDRNTVPRVSSDKAYNARFFALFILSMGGFALAFYKISGLMDVLTPMMETVLGNAALAGFVLETFRLAISAAAAFLVSELCIRSGIAQREMVQRTYVEPVKNFFERYGRNIALLLLILVGLYRISDTVLGVMANVFYQDMGFTKTEIAAVSKTFGLAMTILGGFVGGVLSIRFGVVRILFMGALLSSLTNLLFMALSNAGHQMTLLYWVISADSLAGGIASAAFIAFLSSLTDISFTAMQYAIFSSLMTLIPKIIGGYSGTMVDSLGYPVFFLITAIMGIPVLFLIWILGRTPGFETKRNGG